MEVCICLANKKLRFIYSVVKELIVSQTNLCFHVSVVQHSFENTVRKGEIACYEQFPLFPQRFLAIWRNFCHFLSNLKFSSEYSFSLEESKIGRLEKG